MKLRGRQGDGGVFLQQMEKEINKIPETSLKPHLFPELQLCLFKGNSENDLMLHRTLDCFFPEKQLSISLLGVFFQFVTTVMTDGHKTQPQCMESAQEGSRLRPFSE